MKNSQKSRNINWAKRPPNGPSEIQSGAEQSGDAAQSNTGDLYTPTSGQLGAPSKDSKKRWSTPKNIREFAAQANEVATRVLNGEINIEVARAYSVSARIVGQCVGIEMSRGRMKNIAPDLTIEEC